MRQYTHHRFISLAGALMLTCMTWSSSAQKRPKYEDVLPGILLSEPASAVAELKKYLEAEPTENASEYLQLGLIYHARFKASDPIVQYPKAIANIKLSSSALKLSKQFITEKEVKRNTEEYFNFGKLDDRGKLEVQFDTIPKTIDRFVEEQNRFMENMPSIYESFTESYSYYSKASKIYSGIMGKYLNIKDMFLLYDDDLAKDFDALKANYNSFLEHFEAYTAKTDTFDIGYNQQLKFQEIGIYRLDGLSVEVNFLQDEIPIWNYGQWVDFVQKYIQNEIAHLRTLMAQNEKLIDSKLRKTEEDFHNNTYEQLTVDKEFLFTLRKFDLRSVVEPIFLYKEHKHALMHQEHLSKAIDADSTDDYDRKIASYSRMLHNIKRADTVISEIVKRDVTGSYDKYDKFIDEYYQGIDGIKRYAQTELNTNTAHFDFYEEKIIALARAKYNQPEPENVLKFGKVLIPDHVMLDSASELMPNKLFTTHIVQNIDGSEYLGGVFYNKKEERKTAFICKKDTRGRVKWYKDFVLQSDSTVADSDTELAVLYAGQAGCVFVLNGTNDEGRRFNVILGYDEMGNRNMQHNITSVSYPRSIDFVQRTHSYLVTFKGDSSVRSMKSTSDLYIDNIDAHGVSVWNTSIQFSGSLAGVVVVENGYLISGNYQSMVNSEGETIQSSAGGAVFVIKLNADGKQINQLLLPKSNDYTTNIFFKTGDHAVHLFGRKGNNLKTQIEMNDGDLVHFIVTRDLHLVHNSFGD